MSTFYKSDSLKWPTLGKSKGFTLVELLVVIAIIGTLATLLLLQLGVARSKARDTKRVADINQLRSTVELYYDDNGGRYPTALSIANIGKYISVPTVPTDPVTKLGYKYGYAPAVNPIQYHLWIQMENAGNWKAGDADMDSSGWTSGAGDRVNASLASTETCVGTSSSYAAGAGTDCYYDVGQK